MGPDRTGIAAWSRIAPWAGDTRIAFGTRIPLGALIALGADGSRIALGALEALGTRLPGGAGRAFLQADLGDLFLNGGQPAFKRLYRFAKGPEPALAGFLP